MRALFTLSCKEITRQIQCISQPYVTVNQPLNSHFLWWTNAKTSDKILRCDEFNDGQSLVITVFFPVFHLFDLICVST